MSKDQSLCIPRRSGLERSCLNVPAVRCRSDFAEPPLNFVTRALPENRNGLDADVENGSSRAPHQSG
jgi:hypothetical protein